MQYHDVDKNLAQATHVYPYNLAEYLKDKNFADDDTADFTARSILAMLSDVLTDRERQVIEMRWRDSMTYEEIGKAFSVTRERIRQIEAKATRKLSHATHMRKYVAVPYKDYLREKNRANEAERRLDWMLEHGKYTVDLDDTETKTQVRGADMGDSIEDLDLSVRSYNCLIRSGLTTMGALLTIQSPDDLQQIRNLGVKSADEIIKKVHERGLKFSWERNADSAK